MDLFERTKDEFRHRQAEFLTRELKTCSLYLDLAYKSHEKGDRTSTARAIAYAEDGYATVFRFLSDPQDSKCLTIKATQEFTVKMEGLRKTLDGLQRFREVADGA